MGITKGRGFIIFWIGVFLSMVCAISCKKKTSTDEQPIKPPVRTYVITARADRKGTNTNSEGTAVLKGTYEEGTKSFKYRLEYKDIIPELITLRSGAKGSVGTLIKEIYKNTGATSPLPLSGELVLTSLQERNLLKGLYFVAINTLAKSPEISGVVTLKQQ